MNIKGNFTNRFKNYNGFSILDLLLAKKAIRNRKVDLEIFLIVGLL